MVMKPYVGLPEQLAQEVLWVADEWRKNPLSLKKGGCDVVVEQYDGKVLGYCRIKYPSNYIKASLRRMGCNPFGLAKDAQIELVKRYIVRIFVRDYEDEEESLTAAFVVAWESTSSITPWEALEKFEHQEEEYYDNWKQKDDWDDISGIPDPRIYNWETNY